MKEVNGIQILEDIELEGIVGGAQKKVKRKVKKKSCVRKKAVSPSPHGGGPELI